MKSSTRKHALYTGIEILCTLLVCLPLVIWLISHRMYHIEGWLYRLIILLLLLAMIGAHVINRTKADGLPLILMWIVLPLSFLYVKGKQNHVLLVLNAICLLILTIISNDNYKPKWQQSLRYICLLPMAMIAVCVWIAFSIPDPVAITLYSPGRTFKAVVTCFGDYGWRTDTEIDIYDSLIGERSLVFGKIAVMPRKTEYTYWMDIDSATIEWASETVLIVGDISVEVSD